MALSQEVHTCSHVLRFRSFHIVENYFTERLTNIPANTTEKSPGLRLPSSTRIPPAQNLGFAINALSGDGVIEGIEHESLEFALGVQWHPELMHRKESSSKNLFAAFIDEAQKRRSNINSQ